MSGRIALEEHFAIPETLGDSEQYAVAGEWTRLRARLLDLHDMRLSEMDAHGIQLAVLSLNAPGVQGIPEASRAIDVARRANDALADAVAKQPNRLAGFAALPLQDPDAAIRELDRAVRILGFKGALVNGFSDSDGRGPLYYDAPEYRPFWAALEQLDVPFYLHPRDPLPSREPIYDGHPWFRGSAWAFGVETAMHALRLMGSGLFDRVPGVRVILGHLGEGLPYSIWRLDHRLAQSPRGIPARRRMADYLRSNCYLTTSGHFRTPSLRAALEEVGAGRILFSVDYPFEHTLDATSWLDAAEIPQETKARIGWQNAAKLLRLPRPG
jgi:2,3-dihydroxybenzoate decarboxylase